VRILPLATVPVVVSCRRDHWLADQSTPATPAMLAGETFVGAPPGYPGLEAVDRFFAAGGVERDVAYVANDPPTALELVAAGLGVALLPRTHTSVRPDLCAVPLADEDAVWTLVAMVQASAGPAARELLRILKRQRSPGMDQPGMDQPGMDQPGMDQPGMNQPSTNQLGVDGPDAGPRRARRPGANR
jgi:DNA-binding transcriptional LysR family regulator